ncbi:MAG TPA: GSCFA domain-containing protein [Usitatibacter sp.]|nr:GSCFA domain-containing protein [Usitatibacter sp.]
MPENRKARKDLLSWKPSPAEVRPDNIPRWHKGAVYHQFPDKKRMREAGPDALLEGWKPSAPLIGRETRVLAVGSCFARHFTLWLAENGFNRDFRGSAYNALLRFGVDFESPAVIAQQFRWAFDELSPESLLWIDKNRQLVAATDEAKCEVRATLEHTDILVLTLGLSEVWYDAVSGEPLWRALTEDLYDPQRHVFRVETVAQTVDWLEAIERIRSRWLPNLRIVFTVSPIPLKTTFRPVSAVTANTVSKAILRAALDEFLRRHAGLVNDRLFYFPAYEMVTQYFVAPFKEDNRHLVPIVPGTVIATFVKHYCEPHLAAHAGDPRSWDETVEKTHRRVHHHAAVGGGDAAARELLVRIAELEEDVTELQAVCDARQRVIDELKHAADDRLRAIHELDAALRAERKAR